MLSASYQGPRNWHTPSLSHPSRSLRNMWTGREGKDDENSNLRLRLWFLLNLPRGGKNSHMWILGHFWGAGLSKGTINWTWKVIIFHAKASFLSVEKKRILKFYCQLYYWASQRGKIYSEWINVWWLEYITLKYITYPGEQDKAIEPSKIQSHL